MNINNDLGILAKDTLTKLIYNKIIEINNISRDKYGKLYANVCLDDIEINKWLLKHNFVMKCNNNERQRRMSESDSNKNNTEKLILPDIYSYKKTDNLIIRQNSLNNNNNEVVRPTSSSTSSIIQTDCFLSHNWGENHLNHERVKKIDLALKKRGLNTWFDENKINGNIRFKMAEGIDNTKCFIAFITRKYRDKVNSIDMKDNCKYEFSYGMNQLGPQNMIPVIMELEMKDSSKWKGELGAALGNMLYIDFSEETNMEKKYDELFKKIKYINNKNNKKQI
jgi:hypothetical protein